MALEKEKEAPQITQAEEIKENSKFWFFKVVKGGDLEWKIDHRKFIEYLIKSGFRRFDINDDFIFVKIKQRIIYEVTITRVQDEVIQYIKTLEENDLDGISIEELLSKFYTSPATYFNRIKLSMLGIEKNLKLNTDTKDSGFIFYSNCFVKCTAAGYRDYPYTELYGHVFRNQIKQRKFNTCSPEGMFKQFVFNISGKNEQRFEALQTMIGSLLHSFYETKMKAVNLTDSTISDNAEGRTGKTLLGRAISYIKNVCEISGKDFDPTNKHKYSTAKLDTQIVFLNDLRKRFDFESLFNDISDAITVDQKNMQPFTIRAKMLIAANDTFRIEGASAKDRVIEFELADHYSADFSPQDEFGVWFFRDWTENDWLSFDNFMMGCLTLYLKNGVIEADSINLDKRKQIQYTNSDVVEFLDEKIKKGELRCGIDYDKSLLHVEFIQQYPDYSNDKWLKASGNFTRYLKTYASYSPELRGTMKERRSAGKSYIRWEKIGDQQTDIFSQKQDNQLNGLPF
ncbi:MAG TPA: primase-helicase family protein [Prolixibacteraceae bacterium]|nr:primase-helicase family protein [Prolixibacteraceae bacterium]